LRKRADFLKLFDSPNKYVTKGFLVVWQPNDLSGARLGVTASKKIGCAVIRNRVKRYAREIFRCNRHQLPAIDVNLIARREAALMDFCTVQRELEKAFRHIGAATCSKALHSS